MIETIDIELEGVKFQIMQFDAFTALRLEKKTLTILSPLLGVLDKMKSIDDENTNFSGMASIIQNVLLSLSEDEFISYIKTMFSSSYVIFQKEGKTLAPQELKKDDVFNATFIGKNLLVYKLLLEVMKVNKFGFFELLGGGGELTGLFPSMKRK